MTQSDPTSALEESGPVPTVSPSNTVQEVDVTLLYIFATLAFVMSSLFVVALPLCVIALFNDPDVIVVFATVCALAMSVGLIGTGIGLIRRARRARKKSSGRTSGSEDRSVNGA
ncbi:MAG: hypothetical protein KatS3mg104_0424 [Phycisphaerae bacterium]|jgi:uncharacterized membrane protein YqjE|nr:MAG: hypothetical protein KatS3mg104_0424 [Phycisphaerae bacterium]